MNDYQDVFIKYLAKLYYQNSTLPINVDTIYDELLTSNFQNNEVNKIEKISLLNIHIQLKKDFSSKGICTSNGYFFIFENRSNETDQTFTSKISKGIKVYIPLNLEDIYKITNLLFTFLLKEKIIVQAKLPKKMQNTSLILRVESINEAYKINDYLKSLNYSTNISLNPFTLPLDKLSITKDNILPYNIILSNYLSFYLEEKRQSNTLTLSSRIDFSNFLTKELLSLKKMDKSTLSKYGIKSESEYNDYLSTTDIIIKVVNNTITTLDLTKEEEKKDINKQDKILSIISKLTNYYSADEIHNILINYVEKGNINYFTRRDNVRGLVYDNFTPNELKNIIMTMGWNTLLEASYTTYEEYDYYQARHAISKFLLLGKLDGFTRKNNVRSRLGLIIPKIWLREVISGKLSNEEKRVLNMIDTLPIQDKRKLVNYMESGESSTDKELYKEKIDIISTTILEEIIEEKRKK